MPVKELRINIIGAGVSGLTAAIVLEKAGYTPHIFEKTDRVGGRLKTERQGPYVFDHGFQVLLEAYPMAQKYLDYKSLHLRQFLPGAIVFDRKKAKKFGDPLRHLGFLLPIIFSTQVSLADKFKVFLLNLEIKKKSLALIFEEKETTTLDYLQRRGFSSKIIHYFFQPFFSGIFLETELNTSSRMFEFVFKMFAEGQASVPKDGIEAIPKQLKAQLKKTIFHFNTQVFKIDQSGLTLEGSHFIKSDFTIIATEVDTLIDNLRNQKVFWKSCYCFYFKVKDKVIQGPLIGLIPGTHLINNLHYVNALTGHSSNLISVTVINNKGLLGDDLLASVQKELYTLCGIVAGDLQQSFVIPKALPQLDDLQYEIAPSESQLTEGVFLAGDVTLNGSLNAAMAAGENAALGVLGKL